MHKKEMDSMPSVTQLFQMHYCAALKCEKQLTSKEDRKRHGFSRAIVMIDGEIGVVLCCAKHNSAGFHTKYGYAMALKP